ncbi:MAG: class I SAM-dependent methyltransferase [Actinocrinis sp.]
MVEKQHALKQHTLADWRRPQYANDWAGQDVLRDLLDLPRKMSAALIGHDTSPRAVLDIGSGPGAFLEIYLDAFPDARGVWSDGSAAMRELAEPELERFAGRVDFAIAEMLDLSPVRSYVPVDVVLSSRASHHLEPTGLDVFYAQAAGVLGAGGWIVNLDHIAPADDWNLRYRAVRPQFTGPRKASANSHKHNNPVPSLDQHRASLAKAGFVDVDVAWKAFGTVLLMGRKAGA